MASTRRTEIYLFTPHCRSYAFEAERKMGQMLAETERNAGAKGVGPAIAVTSGNHNKPATLASLGITKRESSEWAIPR